jgi:5'-phosphate synthase pdxT subunit
MGPLTIGVLSLQGSVIEHGKALSRFENVRVLEVKTQETLKEVDGLILPGGESTTLSKLLTLFSLMEPLRERILSGMPVWGTCAGMILLAREIMGEPPHLGVMDITVRRNAYGRQIDSFRTLANIPEVSDHPLPLVFIRAPWVEAVGEKVTVLCRNEGRIVAVRQGHMLATSFHPELTDDPCFHRYFLTMVEACKN